MSTEQPHEETPKQDAADARRRRRSTLVAASVAAAVLLAGGGGAYWASTASDGGDPAASQDGPPPLQLDGYQGRASTTGMGVAPGEMNPGGTVYRAEGALPEGPDTAPVYRPTSSVSSAEVRRLATALGVSGSPELAGETWTVGKAPSGGPLLQVARKAPGTWNYTLEGAAGGGCVEPQADDGAAAGQRCPDPGSTTDQKPVSAEEAVETAKPVLKRLGLSGAKLDARRTLGAQRTVDASPMVGGLPTHGWQTGLTIGADGKLAGGHGQLATLDKGPAYPVLSAEKTLAALNRTGTAGGPVTADGGGDCGMPVPGTKTKEKEVTCSSQGQAKPKPLTVRTAVFGLAVHSVQGRPALVPSWLYEVQQPGGAAPLTITHPAVDPRYIAKPKSDGPSKGEPGTGSETPAPVESYSMDGRTMTLHFWGGVCDDYTAAAKETDGTVEVRVTGKEKKPGQVCVKVAKKYTETVTLDKPLGDRKVVEARTGKDVPRHK